MASPIADQFNAALVLGDVDAPPLPPTARPPADSDRPAAPAVDLSQFVLKSEVQTLVEAAVQSQLQQTVREISEVSAWLSRWLWLWPTLTAPLWLLSV